MAVKRKEKRLTKEEIHERFLRVKERALLVPRETYLTVLLETNRDPNRTPNTSRYSHRSLGPDHVGPKWLKDLAARGAIGGANGRGVWRRRPGMRKP